MNEQQYQQPVQAEPTQPQYQPPYQPQYQEPKKEGAGLGGFVDFIAKLLPILTIVFLGLGALSMLYYFVMGVVNAFGYGGFTSFVNGIANSISALAKYIFYAALMAIGAKRIRK